LFNGSKAVFADPGLSSYKKSAALLKSAYAHSALLIDSHGPECEDYKLNLIDAYGPGGAKVTIGNSPEGVQILELESSGFKRLAGALSWKRRFIINSEKMRIEDAVQSSGSNSVEARFQVPPGARVSLAGNRVTIHGNDSLPAELNVVDAHPFEVSIKDGAGSSEAVFSSEYGMTSPGFSIGFKRELRGGEVYVYEVRWQNAG
jgi:hypothetical protein